MTNHVRLPAAAAIATQLALFIASPVVTDTIGPKWTTVLMFAVALLQMQQKPVKRTRHEAAEKARRAE